ncbi:hypothetical protein Aconfl_41490 [Algoriphagus confluentis]|uniref:Uncharacterized protein n=1 Tax=Algoriphagus confluentis TaxID=1697556 RepID=A0ABQ6PU58_9BACT|nr:hypothetical protein Aconfl_41490 [Algoriphagus confluentis]
MLLETLRDSFLATKNRKTINIKKSQIGIKKDTLKSQIGEENKLKLDQLADAKQINKSYLIERG